MGVLGFRAKGLGVAWGTTIEVIKWDTRSLDYSLSFLWP